MDSRSDEPELHFSAMGEAALLCQTATAGLDLSEQERFWALADDIEREPGVREVVPGMNNLLVMFDPLNADPRALAALLTDRWASGKARAVAGKIVEVPVSYGGVDGEDLNWIAERAGLSVEEFVSLHAAGDYTVYALGSQPGFAYLGGLDMRLATPRRETPRPRVEAGSVIIGGAQAGVLSRTTPSGWHIIGRTELEFFNPEEAEPTLLLPGDKLWFVVKEIKA